MVDSLDKIWILFKKLKIELQIETAIPILGIYSKNTKIFKLKYVCTPVLTVVQFKTAKIGNNPTTQ